MVSMDRLKYPNPQQIRSDWMDLNGEWLTYFPENESDYFERPDRAQFTTTIQVPYSYTFKKSQSLQTDYQPVMWYCREFTMDLVDQQHQLLNFEAVDYQCSVWLNGVLVGSHVGGHTPFKIDVTPYLQKNNEIMIRVIDDNATNQPIGKQKWKKDNFLCWYTRTMGIWQNVWLESTGAVYLDRLEMIPETHQDLLQIDASSNTVSAAMLDVTITYHDELISHTMMSFRQGRVKQAIDVSSDDANFRLHYWSPDEPNLYDIELKVVVDGRITDDISSYFGMRDIKQNSGKIYLNDQELYQKLILNQGYYSEGGLTGSADEMVADINKIKEMGFNGHRIHQKIESHRMLYLCDQLGLITWAEFPSNFSFSSQSVDNVLAELPAMVAKHINHPAVCVYVLMNESWGVNEIIQNQKEQNFVNALYYQVKAYDNSRLVIGNDGWEQTLTDICTVHDYNADSQDLLASYQDKTVVVNGSPSQTSGRKVFCEGYATEKVPFIMSEYGGVAYETQHRQDSWGYGDRISSKTEVLERIQALTQSVMNISFCTGFCYTQLTDVEQEVNGLLTANHEYKFNPEEIRKIMTKGQRRGFTFK